MELLREVIRHLEPARDNLLNAAGANTLSREQREELCGLINKELAAAVRGLIPDIGASGRMTGHLGWVGHGIMRLRLLSCSSCRQRSTLPRGRFNFCSTRFPTAIGPTGGGGFQLWGHLF